MRILRFHGLLALLFLLGVAAVKESDFKKCHQSGFCRRNRAYADHSTTLGPRWTSPYQLSDASITLDDGVLRGTVLKQVGPEELRNEEPESVRLPLSISFLRSGTARVTLDEERRRHGDIVLRHESKIRKERYNEVEKLVVVGGLETDASARITHQDDKFVQVTYGPQQNLVAHITLSPFSVDFRRDGVTHVRFNHQGWLNLEHWRPKREDDKAGETTDSNDRADESTWWEESFMGHTDKKPRGPESVALDISFPGYQHVYGIPIHTGPLSLRETRGGEGQYSEPYRLFNTDVGEYIVDSPMSLYGAIPLLQAHRADASVGVFWLNAAETWVDIKKSTTETPQKDQHHLGGSSSSAVSTNTHWMSESGLLDVFVFLGPTPADIARDYGALTGYTTMPPESVVGYHQCRWNYVSDDDVKDVDRRMDQHHIPYDVIWLDIEFSEEKKYFIFQPDSFSDPYSMTSQLDAHGRKLVLIVDPHIKVDAQYSVYEQLRSQDLAVHNALGEAFEGQCWPGKSLWIDTFNPKALAWWKGLFQYQAFPGTAENTYIWNDMNEPSVFDGPEITMPKDAIHHGGWENRDVHNLMGMTYQNATFHALLSRKAEEVRRRPFVLTRSFFAGSQRLGATWTGDNDASWPHLKESLPMLLSLGISGFPFAGADVGGFFNNPSPELLVRWYQAGAFYPFFRAHAHIDTKRREPYLIGSPYTDIITATLRLRYSLMPVWYTAFYEAHRDGSPIIRPMYYAFPSADEGFALDDQFVLGSSGLLVKPVVDEGRETVDIWIPDDEVYYDYFSWTPVPTQAKQRVTVDAPLDTVPMLLRGGHIVTRRDTPRRSSQLQRFDPYTLVVALSRDGKADGELYVDDGDSYEYEDGQYVHRRFVFADGQLASTAGERKAGDQAVSPASQPGDWLSTFRQHVRVRRVVVLGAPTAWANMATAKLRVGSDESEVSVRHVGGEQPFVVVEKLSAPVDADWQLSFV